MHHICHFLREQLTWLGSTICSGFGLQTCVSSAGVLQSVLQCCSLELVNVAYNICVSVFNCVSQSKVVL